MNRWIDREKKERKWEKETRRNREGEKDRETLY